MGQISSMKLIIQIPCYNEGDTLAAVIADLPRELPGVESIEYLIIDDGSADRTVEVARENGVHHVVSLGTNHGLAAAFTAGLHRCIELGADIIVNTDGDNQYQGSCIEELIKPIMERKADIVVGARPIEQIEHFSWLKKKLQRIGSHVVQQISGTDIPDTTSGFRAYSVEAASQMMVFNRYTYTLETIIQAGAMDMRITSVPIGVNGKTRESRLMASVTSYLMRSVCVIIRSYIIYKPFKTFFYTSLLAGIAGLIPCMRYLYFFLSGQKAGHLQSLMLGAILLIISFNLFSLGVIGHIIGVNRKLINDLLKRSRIRNTP